MYASLGCGARSAKCTAGVTLDSAEIPFIRTKKQNLGNLRGWGGGSELAVNQVPNQTYTQMPTFPKSFIFRHRITKVNLFQPPEENPKDRSILKTLRTVGLLCVVHVLCVVTCNRCTYSRVSVSSVL